ncbi:MAG: LysM peptidoglycan-binding domain-containing protein [Thermoanaerobacteraceae bacterium]|nr:LysM peptidoglycan-binding domain-containing protein [Thermoanaerobacteraceae bacterium]
MTEAQHVPHCPEGITYIVQSGDTMFNIAARFGISLDDLIEANPHIADPDLIFPGQILCVPLKDRKACPHGFIYVVRPGDTLFEIARRFGVSVERIVAANLQITDPNVIFPGQRICIPLFPGIPRRCQAFVLYGTEHAPYAKGMGMADWDHKVVSLLVWDLPEPHKCGIDRYGVWVRYKETDDFITDDLFMGGPGMMYCHHRLRDNPARLTALPFLVVGVRAPFRLGPVFLGGILPVVW